LGSKRWAWLKNCSLPPWSLPLALLLVAVLAYGLLIPWLGFYWDDFPWVWIAEAMGPGGLQRYFATNRPVWGLLYQATSAVLGSEPLGWQIFSLLMRWTTALLVWLLLRRVWSRHPQAAAWTSLLFLVYPGFRQQAVSVVYGNLWVIKAAFLLSLYLNILAIKIPQRRLTYHGLGLLFSAVNLLSMEYFLFPDLLRPVLLWAAMGDEPLPPKARLRRVLFNWLPYLALWVGVTIWRAFFFNFQTTNYQLSFFAQLRTHPGQALLALVEMIFNSLWKVSVTAWGSVFTLPDPASLGKATTLAFYALSAAAVLALGIYLALAQRSAPASTTGAPKTVSWAWQAVGIGLLACLLAGWPFWLIQVEPGLIFPLDRFTLPFMLGVSLVLAGLLRLIPPAWLRLGLLAVLVGLAVGYQFRVANDYRRDWEAQSRFFWQLAWRMPGLDAGTALLVNDLPVTHYSDNSLTAPLNWIYGQQGSPDQMDYLLLYPSRVGGSLPEFVPGLPIYEDYLAAQFQGSTSQMVGLYYAPPACLRVLDPRLDVENDMLPWVMQYAALLSNPAYIRAGGQAAMPQVFGAEPEHGWCYYFQEAELARQQGDWPQVVALAEQAFALGEYPNDPAERYTFIEGYAHTAQWDQALEQSFLAQQVSPLVEPVLCRLWQRIADETPASAEQEAARQTINQEFGCVP